MMDKPLGFALIDWIMAAVVGMVKFIEAYRRTGPGGNDKLLAAADGLTAIVLWRALTTCSIALWMVAKASAAGKWLPDLPDEAFSAMAVLVALSGVRQLMAFAMRFKIVRERIDEKAS